MEEDLRGFPLSSNSVRLVKPRSDEMSEMLLKSSSSRLRLVKPESAEMSEMLLRPSFSSVRLVEFPQRR